MMTIAEFVPITLKINAVWGLEFDDLKIRVWYEIMQGFKVNRLIMAINELAMELKFPPRPADIVEKYEDILKNARKAYKETQKISAIETEDLEHCFICRNMGILDIPFPFPWESYTFVVRCRCGRGKDLNRWNKYNITKGLTYLDSETREQKSAYFKDVDDVLSHEEIAIIMARNKSKNDKYLQKVENSEKRKV